MPPFPKATMKKNMSLRQMIQWVLYQCQGDFASRTPTGFIYRYLSTASHWTVYFSSLLWVVILQKKYEKMDSEKLEDIGAMWFF